MTAVAIDNASQELASRIRTRLDDERSRIERQYTRAIKFIAVEGANDAQLTDLMRLALPLGKSADDIAGDIAALQADRQSICFALSHKCRPEITDTQVLDLDMLRAADNRNALTRYQLTRAEWQTTKEFNEALEIYNDYLSGTHGSVRECGLLLAAEGFPPGTPEFLTSDNDPRGLWRKFFDTLVKPEGPRMYPAEPGLPPTMTCSALDRLPRWRVKLAIAIVRWREKNDTLREDRRVAIWRELTK
jgi:hypothetical protein